MPTVEMISTAKRKSLPESKFALPEQRKYPIDTAARVRNAAARLEQQKARMPAADYQKARAAIAHAAKRFGVESQYNAADLGVEDVHTPGPVKAGRRRPGLHMRIGTDGSIEVRHNADPGDPMWGESVALSDGVEMRDAAPVWIQVAKVGQFAGHPAGPFRLDEKVFEEIVRNFRATQNGRVPIDFEHASEAPATEGSIPIEGAPAQGWIVDLDNRGPSGLWALVEWGDKAREYIRAGQYRYISPAVRFNSKDRVTGQPIGARLTSAGLTNQPFLDGMQPLAAKDRPMLDTPLTRAREFMPACRAALSLHELATHGECKDQLDRLREMCRMADDPMGIHEGVDLGDYVRRLRAMMTMPAHATLGELFDAVESMIDAAAIERGATHDDEEPPSGPLSQPMSAMADEPEDAAMADNKTLKDIENEYSVKLKDAEVKLAEVTLQMKERDATITQLRDEIKARDEADATRVAKEQEAEVDEVLAVYADKKGLSAADRPELLTLLRAAPASFRKLYPPVPVAQRHLMRDLTSRSTAPTANGRRPDVPGHVAPPAPQATPAAVQRGAALKALASGASPEQAILASWKAGRPATV